ncbi:MAG: Ribosomal RNA small subunit methyltransferase I [Chlamydiae bacterium]|nr:Ribosomal RNA small subunit methyltransferase I [Chlamydiota bacterium]
MTLYLLPNLFTFDPKKTLYLPQILQEVMATIDGLFCENEKEGRRYLSYFRNIIKKPVNQLPIALFNKNTQIKDLDFLFEPLVQKEQWGYVTDCGMSVIADPGSLLVKKAYHYQIPVETIQGPCSITMALQLSTFPGNRFSFVGYLAKDPKTRRVEIKELEKRSQRNKEVIICIETPFRNAFLLQDLLDILDERTMLCVAIDLMMPTQEVIVKKVKDFKKVPLVLKKRPCLFLICA